MHPLLVEIEAIERKAWEDMARVMPPSLAESIGLVSGPLGGAFFFMAARIPQFQFNWLGGPGLGDDDGACVREAVRRFRSAGQKKFIIQIPPGPKADAISSLARAEGLHPSPLAWAKFVRETRDAPHSETTLTIREAGAAERDVFGETAVAGFGMPRQMTAWLSQLVGRPHWRTYVSYDGEAPAGVGALYVDGDFAWLGVGATRPEMRKKGGQSAMLARRIADAAASGARYAVTETGVPQEGQPAPSYQNILRSGFSVAYARPNWTET
ncbi:MAG TPA: hypothetical protein VFV70_05930 [Hyphomonadaceae bacterium]|nr:hypothetical protein [Hyphomonadaceae bacterium]